MTLFFAFAFGFMTYAMFNASDLVTENLDRPGTDETITILEGRSHFVMADLAKQGLHYRVEVTSAGFVDVALLDRPSFSESNVVKDQIFLGVKEVEETLIDPGEEAVWIFIDNTDENGTEASGPVEVRVTYEIVMGTFYRARIGLCMSMTIASLAIPVVGVITWVRWKRRIETQTEEAIIDIPSQRTRIIVDRSRAGDEVNRWVEGAYFGKTMGHFMLLVLLFSLLLIGVIGIEGFEGTLAQNTLRVVLLVLVIIIPVLLLLNYYVAWRDAAVRITSRKTEHGLEIVTISGDNIPEPLDDVMDLVIASPHGPNEFDRLGGVKVLTNYTYVGGDPPIERAGYKCPRCRSQVMKGVMGQELCIKCDWTKFLVVDEEE